MRELSNILRQRVLARGWHAQGSELPPRRAALSHQGGSSPHSRWQRIQSAGGSVATRMVRVGLVPYTAHVPLVDLDISPDNQAGDERLSQNIGIKFERKR